MNPNFVLIGTQYINTSRIERVLSEETGGSTVFLIPDAPGRQYSVHDSRSRRDVMRAIHNAQIGSMRRWRDASRTQPPLSVLRARESNPSRRPR